MVMVVVVILGKDRPAGVEPTTAANPAAANPAATNPTAANHGQAAAATAKVTGAEMAPGTTEGTANSPGVGGASGEAGDDDGSRSGETENDIA